MFRRAWRRLWATPVFTVFAVVSLALGVGVTTAIHSVVVSLTRNTMAVENADRIGLVVGTDPLDGRRQAWRSVVSRADFDDLSRATTTLGPLAASAVFYQSLVDPPVSELVSGEAVTGSYFATLGLGPHLGRLIQPSDDAAPARIVVLSHRIWRTRFAGDPKIVGRNVRIGGESFEVVGVAPAEFGGLTNRIQSFTSVWVPLSSTTMFPSGAAPPKDPADRRRRQLTVVSALGPDASLAAMSAEAAAIGSRLDAAFPLDMRRRDDQAPQVQPRSWSIRTMADVTDDMARQFELAEGVIIAIVGLVLVVACTNLANLVLARGSSRVHELAVRRALGASRTRLILDQLAETGLLAAMGATGAYVVTRMLLVWFTSANLPISEAAFVQLEPRLDAATLALAGLSVFASLVVFGLAPAVQLTRAQLRPALAADPGGTGSTRWRTRRTLIAVQVMISLSFFLMAAFAVRVVQSERGGPSGIDVDRLAMGVLNFRLPPWNEARAREVVDRIVALAAAQPGLDEVAVVSGMPFGTTYTPGADVTTLESPFVPGKDDYTYAPFLVSTPSVFQTLGVPVLRGRGFDARDTAASQPVAVMSEMTARQLFGTAEVLGRQFQLRSRVEGPDSAGVHTMTIIGVAGDTDTQHRQSRNSGVVYVPLSQVYEPLLTLVGRTSGDPAAIIEPLRALTQRADPDLVLDRPATATLTVTGLYVLLDVVSRLATGLAVLAMALGMAGLFGVLSHLVSRRTREMGLRMALGAEPGQIRRLILRDGLQPVASGLTMGFLIAAAVRLLMLSDNPITVSDAVVFVLAPVPIIAAALVACYWPARRASRVDPNVALREL
jgi:predicted permease